MARPTRAAVAKRKHHYWCDGGPIGSLYLPGIERGDYKTALPDVIDMGDGSYHKTYDPENNVDYYRWISG